MELENISFNFKGKLKYLEEIKKDLTSFPENTFNCKELEIEVKDEEESILIKPYKESKKVDHIYIPKNAQEIIIDLTNQTTNFKYNKKTYYIFTEKR